jgi:PAS domain S-box-containing protein
MLSMSASALQDVSREQQYSEIGNLILRTSSELAKCESREIEKIIQQSIADVRAIEHADEAGWFLLTDSGALTDIFHSAQCSLSLCPALRDGLHQLPWCLAQLNAGKAVLIYETGDLFSIAEVDQKFLEAAEVRSLALLPSTSVSLGRTVLILSSNSMETEWSDGIVEQCTLLEDIFSNAYQRSLSQNESLVEMKCFQQLFSASVGAMAILDCNGQILSTNQALRELLGYSEEELQKMRCVDIATPLNQGDATPHLQYSPNLNITNHRCERTLIRKDKTLVPVEVKVDQVERPFREESFLLVAIEDLTVQKFREKELRRRQSEVEVLASLLIQSQENERKRLSRELHDDIGQRLSLAASEAALMASQQSTSELISTDRLEELRDELDSLCTDIHEMSHDLHSYKLQHLGLKSALKDLCRRLSQSSFRIDLHVDEFEEPSSEDVSLCLYRVAQESLNNALKHARTSIVAVTLTRLQNMFYMTIQDSGVGFDSSSSSQGLGLASMSERLRLVNGQFRLHSVPGRGTEIWVSVPDQLRLNPEVILPRVRVA